MACDSEDMVDKSAADMYRSGKVTKSSDTKPPKGKDQREDEWVQGNLLTRWANTFTLRSTRAQFLVIFEEATYLNLAIHKEEVSNLKASEEYKDALERAQERFILEGEEMRRTLRSLPDALKTSFYERLGIVVNSRRRKRQLLDIIWSKDVSLEVT